jgi:hypothetical protein
VSSASDGLRSAATAKVCKGYAATTANLFGNAEQVTGT